MRQSQRHCGELIAFWQPVVAIVWIVRARAISTSTTVASNANLHMLQKTNARCTLFQKNNLLAKSLGVRRRSARDEVSSLMERQL